ncbi:MAG: penicillin-binding protein 2 [Deltaproteobacteria bacterium]|nr:penicillin-binding protein 2 [Deltaproteobacteria bacterium]
MPLEFKETTQDKVLKGKIKIAVVIVAVFFSLIILRLCYLQIIKGAKYAELSTNNRIRQTALPAPRGHIFSSDNQTLVDNTPSFDLILIPQDTLSIDAVLNDVSALLSINKENLADLVQSRRGRPRFEPIVLKKNLSWNEMSTVLSKKNDLPGISIDVVPRRRYLTDVRAPHVFGFLGEADQQDISLSSSRPYRRGELIGKYGLEKWAEDTLRGTCGFLQTEVDAFGKRKNVLAKIEPRGGKDIWTTLIPEVQKAAEHMLEGKTGAVVALNPRNGHILAMASAPLFDPNLFSRGISPADWRYFTSHPHHPLMNRAIQSQQPPGSIFKIVTIVAALEEKIIDPEHTFFCPGYFVLGNRRFGCWKKEGHGHVNMQNSLIVSCDTYFYNLALRLGIDTLVKYAEILGFGFPGGIELGGERPGLLPSPGWLRGKTGARWQKGDTLNFCIGQGFLQATPLQMALVYSGIANEGLVYRPTLIARTSKNGLENAEVLRRFSLAETTFDFLKNTLCDVVHAPNGTGYNARVPGALVAGKTGTAQVVSLKKKPEKGRPVPRHLENHAWFVAFSPVEEPEVVVSVFLEHGGGGGGNAAPVAREVIRAFYEYKKKRGI